VLCLQSQASNPQVAYLSISMPPLCHGVIQNELSSYTIEMVKGLCPNVVGIAEPAKEGYQLTLKLNLNQIPQNKGLFPLTTNLQHGCHPSTQLNNIGDCKHFIHTITMAMMPLHSKNVDAIMFGYLVFLLFKN